MGAGFAQTGELITKPRLEQPSPESGENFSDRDLVRTPRQCITAGLAANTLYKFALSQDSHQLRDIGDGERFRFPDFRDGQSLAIGAGNAQQTSQAVLFLCTQFHIISVGPTVQFSSVHRFAASL